MRPLLLTLICMTCLAGCTNSSKHDLNRPDITGTWARGSISIDGEPCTDMQPILLQLSADSTYTIHIGMDSDKGLDLHGTWSMDSDSILLLTSNGQEAQEVVILQITDSTLNLRVDPYTTERYTRL